MKPPKVEGPVEPSREHRRQPDVSRPRRAGKERGPLGFRSVMRDVKGGNRPGGTSSGQRAPGAPHGAGATLGSPAVGSGLPGSTAPVGGMVGTIGAIAPIGPDGLAGGTPVHGATTPGMAGFDPALAQAASLDAGARAAAQMGAVQGVGEQLAEASYGVRDATEALAAQDRSATHQALVQPHVPTPLGRMTPAALLETVLDESRRLEIEEAMKELHVELEPEDLGPLVVRLRRGPDGSLDIAFRTREGDAARMLERGSELLRDRLAEAGFASVRIDVRRDEELRFAD